MMIILALLSDSVCYAKTDDAETAAKTVRSAAEPDGGDDPDAAAEGGEGSGESGQTDEADGTGETKAPSRPDISEMTHISIATYEDWCAFAGKCRLDSWSADKYVTLTENIDFNMKEFIPVPYFAGVFEGDGHTLSKAAYTKEMGSIGIFSVTAPSAVIRNLNVIGVMKPSGRPALIGGIAGDNSGLISNCRYDGYVEGYDHIGGIVGYNGPSGIISACTVTGKVTGLHHVGGICGTNAGLVTGCSGKADINTVTKEVETGIADIKVEEMFTTLMNLGREEGNKVSLDSSTAPVDIGGIAGSSTGEISMCKSESSVGYDHVGYNVGGIAGRQSGYVHDCYNNGPIRGRKDVGGITGQAEPYIRLDLSADIIAQMSKAISELHDSVDRTIKDTDSSSAVASARLNVIKSFADRALGDTGYLASSTTDFVNGVVGSTNEIMGRIEYVVDESSKSGGPVDDLTDAGADLKNAAADIEKAAEDLDIYDYLNDADKARYDEAKKAIRDASEEYEKYYEEFYDSPEAETKRADARQEYIDLKADAGEWPSHDYDELSKEQKAEADRAAEAAVAAWAASSAKDKYDDAHSADTPPKTYLDVMSENAAVIADIIMSHADEIAENEKKDGKAATKDLKRMAQDLKDAGKGFRSILKDIAGREPVRFPELSDEYRYHTNSLVSNIQGMSDNIGTLNSELLGGTDTVCADLEGVNDKFSSLMLLFTDAMDGALDMDYSEVFEDESNDVCSDSTDATIADCENSGSICADINTGGIAGTMAEEYDFDLEGDLTGVKDAAKKSTYRTKCVLRNDRNYGEVKGKKSYVGGACGLHEIGTILKCSDFAKVSSETSDYVGGIAGRSYGTIRESYGKGILSGQSYVGGIAGEGVDIIECACMPTITQHSDHAGAVTGCADDGGVLKNNVFVSDTLAGVDRVSLEGKAEPVTYAQLMELEGIPYEFSRMNVSFIVDGKSVADISKRWGETVSTDEIPAAKAAEDALVDDGEPPILEADEYIDWECDETMPVFSDTEITGDIVRYSSALAGEQEDGGRQSAILVDGRFKKGDRLEVTEISTGDGTEEEYIITIPDDGQMRHRIRYRKRDDSDVAVLVAKDGLYSETECGAFGRYLTFEADGNSVFLKVVKKEQKDLRLMICAAAGSALILAAAAICLIRLRRRRRRRRSGRKT